MRRRDESIALGWKHPLWELVRYYRALRTNGASWLATLVEERVIRVDADTTVQIPIETVDALRAYLEHASGDLEAALQALRTEGEANDHCKALGAVVGATKTKSKDHHQSSKALIAAVTKTAVQVCGEKHVEINTDPQRRCIWCIDGSVHVSARNMDGAIPTLLNPEIVWEIKEYWGVTSGGSKMSDAVYECHLLGRELRDYEERIGHRAAHHVVFLDGKDQWKSRRSDLLRFIDLHHQGLIDHLLIGREVETDWAPLLRSLLP